MKIYKYPLEIIDEQVIELPRYPEMLSVQATEVNTVMLWAAVNPAYEMVKHKIKIFGTGHDLDEDLLNYIGTVQTHHGALVWHIFDGGEIDALPTKQPM